MEKLQRVVYNRYRLENTAKVEQYILILLISCYGPANIRAFEDYRDHRYKEKMSVTDPLIQMVTSRPSEDWRQYYFPKSQGMSKESASAGSQALWLASGKRVSFTFDIFAHGLLPCSYWMYGIQHHLSSHDRTDRKCPSLFARPAPHLRRWEKLSRIHRASGWPVQRCPCLP